MNGTLRVCKQGHHYYKSSDCPTCPFCEQERKPASGFLSIVSAPARRALESAGIKTLEQLSKRSEEEILQLQLHGMGPAGIVLLRKALKENGKLFRKP